MNYNYNYITSSSSNADRYLFNNSLAQLGSFLNPSKRILIHIFVNQVPNQVPNQVLNPNQIRNK